ncbi:hypothetical protein EON62_04795 [archaeon]|nr:MAG: hypothetical protein EON62_04795 [archaeon]
MSAWLPAKGGSTSSPDTTTGSVRYDIIVVGVQESKYTVKHAPSASAAGSAGVASTAQASGVDAGAGARAATPMTTSECATPPSSSAGEEVLTSPTSSAPTGDAGPRMELHTLSMVSDDASVDSDEEDASLLDATLASATSIADTVTGGALPAAAHGAPPAGASHASFWVGAASAAQSGTLTSYVKTASTTSAKAPIFHALQVRCRSSDVATLHNARTLLPPCSTGVGVCLPRARALVLSLVRRDSSVLSACRCLPAHALQEHLGDEWVPISPIMMWQIGLIVFVRAYVARNSCARVCRRVTACGTHAVTLLRVRVCAVH